MPFTNNSSLHLRKESQICVDKVGDRGAGQNPNQNPNEMLSFPHPDEVVEHDNLGAVSDASGDAPKSTVDMTTKRIGNGTAI